MSSWRSGDLVLAPKDRVYRLDELVTIANDYHWYVYCVFSNGRYIQQQYSSEFFIEATCSRFDALKLGLFYNELNLLKRELDRWTQR